MAYKIQRKSGPLGKERLIVRLFSTSEAMYRFLNTGDNACHWRETSTELKPGTYAYVGGQWHNVKQVDPSLLSHI